MSLREYTFYINEVVDGESFTHFDPKLSRRTSFFALPQSVRAYMLQKLNPKRNTTRGRKGIWPKHISLNSLNGHGFGKKPVITGIACPMPQRPDSNREFSAVAKLSPHQSGR